MSRSPVLSVVIPTYNRRELLARTLPTWLSQKAAAGDFEIVVVVDGSTDGTCEFLDSYRGTARLRVVAQENRGLAAARNQGVKAALGKAVLFLDDDMLADAGLFAAHAKAHEGETEQVVFGKMGLAEDIPRSFLKQGIEGWTRELALRLSTPGYRFRFDDCHFGHASITRSLFLRASGFDESFVKYGNEDYEFGWRLLQKGASMRFVDGAMARQIYHKTLSGWLQDLYWVGRADLALADKHPSLADDLRFAQRAPGPVKRLARWSVEQSMDPLWPAWKLMEVVLGGGERMGIPGSVLRRGQYWLGERFYWRGYRDARRESEMGPVRTEPGHGSVV